MNTLKRIAIVLFLSSFAFLFAGCGIGNPGQSEKIGVIVKVSKSGIISDTWEAQIVRGGFQNGTGAMGAAFDFTIEDYSVVEQVKQYMENGTEVKITYRSEGFYAATRTESGGHFLVSIEPVATHSVAK